MAQITELELVQYTKEDILGILGEFVDYSKHNINILPQMVNLKKEQLINIFRYLNSSLKDSTDEEEEKELHPERPSKHVLLKRAIMDDNDSDEESEDEDSSLDRFMEELTH